MGFGEGRSWQVETGGGRSGELAHPTLHFPCCWNLSLKNGRARRRAPPSLYPSIQGEGLVKCPNVYPEEKEEDDHLVELLAERSERQAGPGTLRGGGRRLPGTLCEAKGMGFLVGPLSCELDSP